MLKILGRTSSINVRKVLWTCDEIGLDYVREDWGIGYRPTQDPEFRALNPKGLVPVVIDGSHVLTESNAIMRYLARKAGRDDLLPADPLGAAQVEAWMEWQNSDLTLAWRYAFLGIVRKNPRFTDEAMMAASLKDWDKQMEVLEAHLHGGAPWLAADHFTLADLIIGLAINRRWQLPRPRPEWPATTAYFARLLDRPAAKGHIGEGTD